MRPALGLLCTAVFASFLAVAIAGEDGGRFAVAKRALIDSAQFRPAIALHDVRPATSSGFVTITGVVFSRSPIDRVTVGDRSAVIRPAEAADLVSLARTPDGATELPFRTFFEVPDAALTRVGANDLEIVAATAEGRRSDVHRLTLVRSAEDTPTDH